MKLRHKVIISVGIGIDAVIHGQLPIGSKTNPAEDLQDDNDGYEEAGK